MPLPKTLVYNELSGDEIKHILVERVSALLSEIPYLQRHTTLPRVKMTLEISLICWADQKVGEIRKISDDVEISTENRTPTDNGEGFFLTDSVDASPKGSPPDKVRHEHGLGVPTPTRGPMSVEDQLVTVEGRVVTMDNGAIVDRTGVNAESARNATVVKQDFGPMRNRAAAPSPVKGNQERDHQQYNPFTKE